ncbi:MAG: hypothetical protein LLF96_02660, partial [Eubacteriales bacterium]|nr:hypothetical protein [Eubacteriales bacterium]
EPEDPFVGEETFDPEDPFFPPIADEPPQPGEADALPPEEVWPYAPYPQSEAQFANSGYTYPEYVEPEETYEYADEDEAPRNLYVEPDEAAQAKRLLWDKYLKGGRRP